MTQRFLEHLKAPRGWTYEDLYGRAGRDPHSIKVWLINEGYEPSIVDYVLFKYAQRMADGETYGMTSNGLSELSLLIRRDVNGMSKRKRDISPVVIKTSISHQFFRAIQFVINLITICYSGVYIWQLIVLG